MERHHIELGPGRMYGPDRRTLIEIHDATAEFESKATTDPATKGFHPLIAALEPMEIHSSATIEWPRPIDDRHPAWVYFTWYARGPVRWKEITKAASMRTASRRRRKAEVW